LYRWLQRSDDWLRGGRIAKALSYRRGTHPVGGNLGSCQPLHLQ